MDWDLDTLPQRLQNVTLSTQQVPIDSSSCIDSQDFNRAANFTDIISSELVLICIAGYLPVPSLLSLSSTTKDIRAVMHSTPGVWRTCDFTDFLESSQDCSQKNLVKFLRQHYVSRDCRVLILDGLAFDHQFLDNLLLREMPALHSRSRFLVSVSPTWTTPMTKFVCVFAWLAVVTTAHAQTYGGIGSAVVCVESGFEVCACDCCGGGGRDSYGFTWVAMFGRGA